MTPENFLLQLSTAQERWKETAFDLKTDVQGLTVEVRRLSDTMIALQSQDVAGQLNELRRVEIVDLKRRLKITEDELLTARTAVNVTGRWLKVTWIIGGAIASALAWLIKAT